ncbi:Phospholipase C [Mortierella polycephala]|uniref:Phosphoinositide phospholipase C n=1 Tax=Mortierella polycephala TaxID=41804 RepID=A0A9P6QFZ4_9FUNG|nr:Phospholipase C [Mortierella polycephala]
MFGKIKRVISAWGDDEPSSPKPQQGSSPEEKNAATRKNSFRNSLPARFRNPSFRESARSSSSEALYSPSPAALTPSPQVAVNHPNQDITETDKHGNQPVKSDHVRASTFSGTAPTPIPGASSADKATSNMLTEKDTVASSPRSLYIRRTSSFQSQRASSESQHEEPREEDIIIFSSTPPVTIAPSSSVKIPRAGATAISSSPQMGSPDYLPTLSSSTSSINQETSVVQWPRGGASSAVNRSQEQILKTNHRSSVSSDASLKDVLAPVATTPPAVCTLRQDFSQRPSLDRRISRSGTANVSNSATMAVPDSSLTQNTMNTHPKAPSDGSTDSNALTELSGVGVNASTSVPISGSTTVAPSASASTSSLVHTPSLDQSNQLALNSSGDSLSSVSPAVVKQLAAGVQMLKISAKKQHSRLFKLDLEQGRILWDSRKLGRINVEQIKELRKGKAAKMYREQLRVKPEHEERWLTIIYSSVGKYKALHLVAPTKDTFQDWITALEHMWSAKREVAEGLPQLQRRTNQWLKEHWMDADKNVDSKLGYEEVVRLCHRLNINFSRKEIRPRFDQADENNKGFLDFSNFTHFVKLLKERKEIINLFNNMAKSDSMTLEEFKRFMIDVQKTKFDEDHIKDIYGKHTDKTAEKFTVDSFTSFLLSVDNSVVAPHHTHVVQDMSQTLSNYYISSSHNTYLLGNQLAGVSSIEGYIRALQNGCRCVELDCWDGSDGQPVIYHGRTLTSKILFRDVIEAISTYAFVNSPYPLILSLEIHCDLDQQEIMAGIMRNKLGSWLVVTPLDFEHTNLPSPDDLKFKILIKSKVLPPDTQAQEYSTDTESESERESETDSDGVRIKKPKTKSKKVRIARALSDISIYCQSRHFPGFTHDGCSPFKIISFSERVSLQMVKQSLHEFINMNKTHLTRIYPAGFRINSTNYDPHHHWAAGSQVVALNYQNHDRGMQMNSAMFTMNGRCGYVLKPESLRLRPGEVCNHDKAPSFMKSHPLDVTLEIISAQQLPRPNETTSGDVVDPVCEIELLIPGQSTIKYKTRHINDNGFNPVWQESFNFKIDYEHPELVFFRFVVQDEDIKFSDLIASYCISLDCLQEGYRHIPLHDSSGDPFLYSTLFIKVSIQPVSVSSTPLALDTPLPPVLSKDSQSFTDSSTDERTLLKQSAAKDVDINAVRNRPLPELPPLSPVVARADHTPLPPTPPPKQ